MRGRYADRRAAGQLLAHELEPLRESRPVILALPRGGVPVAFEIARALHAMLDVLIVRKIGLPGHEELGIGALVLTSRPQMVMDEPRIRRLMPDQQALNLIIEQEIAEAHRRQRLYRGDRPLPRLKGRTVVVVDDGLATGATARAALQAIGKEEPSLLILAVPVGAPDSIDSLRGECDLLLCPLQPHFFGAVGAHYVDFDQVEDSEVLDLLERAAEPEAAGR